MLLLAETLQAPRRTPPTAAGHPYTMTRPTRTTREAAAVMGVSRVTAWEYLRVWAALTENVGCTDAGDGCLCAEWPHTVDGVTGPRGGRPGYVTDAAQLDVHAARLRVLEGREAA